MVDSVRTGLFVAPNGIRNAWIRPCRQAAGASAPPDRSVQRALAYKPRASSRRLAGASVQLAHNGNNGARLARRLAADQHGQASRQHHIGVENKDLCTKALYHRHRQLGIAQDAPNAGRPA